MTARRKKSGHPSRGITLRAKGVELHATPRPRGGLQLSLGWKATRGLGHFHAIARLDERRADDFFAELAHACGYQVSYRPSGGRTAWCSALDGAVLVGLSSTAGPTLSCHAVLSPAQSLRMLRHLVHPLGWNLHA